MNTLEIERRLLAKIQLEHDIERRAELKEELNTLLMIDIEKWRDNQKIEDLSTRLAIAENM